MLLLLSLLCPATAIANENPENKSFVLIQSGSGNETVQECRISRENGGYSLEIKENSRIWLPQERVLCVATSMEELYKFRKQRIAAWKSGDHLQMGRWCLRYGLIDEASNHYLAIPAHLRSHTSVAQFGQAVKSRMLSDNQFRQYLGLGPIAATNTRQVAASSANSTNQSADSSVVTASAQESTLDISPEAKARFYSRVQPILKNRCSQAACHGFRGKSDFRLYEPYGQAFNRISESNLIAAAKHAASKPGSETPALIEYATSVHGVQRSPGIKPNETQLIEELAIWCRLIASPVVSADARSIDAGRRGVMSAVGTQPQKVTMPTGATQPTPLQPVGPGQSELRSVPRGPSAVQPEASSPEQPATNTNFPRGTQPPDMSEIDQLDRELKRILGEAERVPAGDQRVNDPFDATKFNNLPR
ncbi:MAG: hypothetical protein Aurels2KO_25860 [Aureliella sp.]